MRYLKDALLKAELRHMTGIPVYMNGLADRTQNYLLISGKSFTKTNVKEFIGTDNWRVSLEDLMDTMNKLYYT